MNNNDIDLIYSDNVDEEDKELVKEKTSAFIDKSHYLFAELMKELKEEKIPKNLLVSILASIRMSMWVRSAIIELQLAKTFGDETLSNYFDVYVESAKHTVLKVVPEELERIFSSEKEVVH